MTLTNAEKQRRYRERALKDPDGLLLARLQVMLSAHAYATLDRMCYSRGRTKRELVETAILNLDGYTVTCSSPATPPKDTTRPDEPDESRLYEDGSGLSAWVLGARAKSAIEQISKNDPNAIAAIESIRARLERQLQIITSKKKD